jgi:hypothetical protein
MEHLVRGWLVSPYSRLINIPREKIVYGSGHELMSPRVLDALLHQ